MGENRPWGRLGWIYSLILWILGRVEKTLFFGWRAGASKNGKNRGLERPRARKVAPSIRWVGCFEVRWPQGRPRARGQGLKETRKQGTICSLLLFLIFTLFLFLFIFHCFMFYVVFIYFSCRTIQATTQSRIPHMTNKG